MQYASKYCHAEYEVDFAILSNRYLDSCMKVNGIKRSLVLIAVSANFGIVNIHENITKLLAVTFDQTICS